MLIDPRWARMTPSEWNELSEAWLAERRGSASSPESDVSEIVVMMNVTATGADQWQFILAAVASAQSDDELGHVAAGPLEHLLGWHGDDFIAAVEQQAAGDPKFARMLTGAWRYRMSEAVWARVQALQAAVPNPLCPSGTTE